VSDSTIATVLPVDALPHRGIHGQLLYGEDPTYLSHLAVFMGEPVSHPHNFQVVLEVSFSDPSAEATYLQSLRATPDDIHTAVPPPYDQNALVVDEPGRQLHRTLAGTRFVRGHFEQGGQQIMPPTDLDLERVVYFREFTTGGERDEAPHYLLFGRSNEAHLTHLISAPPDFQQILKVEVTAGDGLPEQLDELLAEGLYLSLPDRDNTEDRRLRTGETIDCGVDAETSLAFPSVELRVAEESYCEAGELSSLVTGPFNVPAACVQ
jgi:hypothetical protein